MKSTFQTLTFLAIALASTAGFAADPPPCTGKRKTGCGKDCGGTANSHKCEPYQGARGQFDFEPADAKQGYISTTQTCAKRFNASWNTTLQAFVCDKPTSDGCGNVPDDKCNSPVE